MVRIFESLIREFTPAYAYIEAGRAFCGKRRAVWASIPGIYWMNYFGQEYVDFIGRDRILSCGWVKTEPFGNSIMTWTSPELDMPDEVRAHMETLYQNRLGAEYFKQPGEEFAAAISPELEKIKERIVGKKTRSPSPPEVIKQLVGRS